MSSASTNATPYYRLSTFYLFYFASLGAFLPYWSLYLQYLGFSPSKIGELIAITMATKVFAPYIWGWIADHFGRRLFIIRLASFLAAISFCGIFYQQSFAWLALVLSVYSFFWHAVLPQFEATTINHLGKERIRYSRIRLWGSIGFIATAIGLGPLFSRFGVTWLPAVFVLLLSGIWLATQWLKDSPESQQEHPPVAIWQILRQWPVLSVLIACFLMQASHGAYYGFFSIFLEEHQYSPTSIGLLWALGVFAEILVFMVVHRWLERVGALKILQLALLITVIRWVLTASYIDNLPVLLFAQTMHAASYGLFHASAIELVNHFFPGRLQGRGQALYSSVGFGLGNAVGILGSGYLWDSWGGSNTYLLAAVICLAGLLVALTSKERISSNIA